MLALRKTNASGAVLAQLAQKPTLLALGLPSKLTMLALCSPSLLASGDLSHVPAFARARAHTLHISLFLGGESPTAHMAYPALARTDEKRREALP